MIQKFLKQTVLILLCSCSFHILKAQTVLFPTISGNTSFAIIVDSTTFARCLPQIEQYKQCIEAEGLPVFVVARNWDSPEAVKIQLQQLHRDYALEGCVFVGDIPIVLVTKAQHLTSAFKMDEVANALRQCSVPSDRYYDDFDLIFTPLSEPSDGLLHYYSMAPESPQYIACDIYSARIKAQKSNGDPYTQISRYLEKAVAQHRSNNYLDNFVSFTGHGSYSNSLTAWASEQQITNEQFGEVFMRKHNAKYLRYSMEPYMKFDLIRELKRKDLDFMVFHEHGDYFRQYLSGEPQSFDIDQHIALTKSSLRSLYRRRPSSAREYAEKLGVDSLWFADAMTPQAQETDSLLDLRTGLILEEVNDIAPQARFVIFDACYNGDFREDDYIAGKYIFAPGDCVAAWANSVNVLQDKSAFDLIGLLGRGMRIGLWAKNINILESHITGDPTFFFQKPEDFDRDLNAEALNTNVDFWKSHLSDPVPDMQCLALIRLYEANAPEISDILLTSFETSPYAVVRHTAFRLSESLNDANFKTILIAAANDEFEFLRRIAVTRMGRVGDDDFIPVLVKSYLNDHNAARVAFQITQSIGCFDRDKMLAAVDSICGSSNLAKAADYRKALLRQIDTVTVNGRPSALDNIAKKERSNFRLMYISFLKNKPLNQFVKDFTAIMEDETEDPRVRLRMAESLAWFNLSVNKDLIIESCHRMLEKGNMSPDLTREISRTLARLTSKK